MFIGIVAKLRGQYALAVEWLKEAERLAETDDTVDIYTVKSQLLEIVKLVPARFIFHFSHTMCKNFSDAFLQHDHPGNTSELNEANFFTKPLLSLESMRRKENQKVRNVLYEKYAGRGRNCSYWEVNYWGLCRGAKLLVSCLFVCLFKPLCRLSSIVGTINYSGSHIN